MKGNAAVITSLLSSASMEAALMLQYQFDKRDLKFRGLDKLGKRLGCFGEDCEDFVKEIVDKIFLLGGSPTYTAGSVSEADGVTEILQRALESENAIFEAFNVRYLEAQNAKDADTRNQYEHWIKKHEHEHVSWLEQQLALIEQFGELEYLNIQLS